MRTIIVKDGREVIDVIAEELEEGLKHCDDPKKAMKATFQKALADTRLLPGWNRDMEECLKENIVEFVFSLIDYA